MAKNGCGGDLHLVAVLDTGCMQSVVGEDTLKKWQRVEKVARFKETKSTFTFRELMYDVVPGKLQFLLSKTAMSRLQIKIDTDTATATILDGVTIKHPETKVGGHWVLPLAKK